MVTTIVNTLPYVWMLVKCIVCGVIILALPIGLGYVAMRCWETLKERRKK